MSLNGFEDVKHGSITIGCRTFHRSFPAVAHVRDIHIVLYDDSRIKSHVQFNISTCVKFEVQSTFLIYLLSHLLIPLIFQARPKDEPFGL